MKILSGNYPQVIGNGLSSIKGLIHKLISLFTVTEQELEDAGVYLFRYPD